MPDLTKFLLDRIAEDEEQIAWTPLKIWPSRIRVLAECETKRRIIELHRPERYDDVREPWCHTCGNPGGYPCGTLKLLAQPYVDHPDYNETWRAE